MGGVEASSANYTPLLFFTTIGGGGHRFCVVLCVTVVVSTSAAAAAPFRSGKCRFLSIHSFRALPIAACLNRGAAAAEIMPILPPP